MLRVVGTWGLAVSVINIVVGAGIFVLPAALAASIGPYAPLAFLGCGLAVGAVALCLAEGGSRVPTSGGIYGYVNEAFGPLAAYVSGTLLWAGDVLACGGIAAALGAVCASIMPQSLAPATRVLSIVGVTGAIALINIGGVVRGTRLIEVATVLKLLPLLVFVLAGTGALLFAHHAGALAHAAVAHAAVTHAAVASAAAPAAALAHRNLGRGLILGVFAFSGMETSLAASGEVRHPARTIPRALAAAMLSVTVLYIAIQLVAQGLLGGALATSSVPLSDAMARIHPALRALMLAGAAVSMFGWMGTDILGTPRLLFAFARDGLMPRVLGRVHPRTHAPHVAILCYAALVLALALSGSFAELAVLSSLASAALYIAGCAAAWRLRRRRIAHAGPPLNFPALGAIALVAIGAMLAMIALASRLEIIGLAILVAASAAVYAVVTRLSRSRIIAAQ
ncbi:MAG TPA: amino acid permease [Steroidobacteraceae bacterium]|nr:amino acid permease [Steroidobacteraceae bacterium]